jgi:hypothetical protein
MKTQLLIAMMATAVLLFLVTGANAQYCPNCSLQEGAVITGQQGNEEMSPATSGAQNGSVEFVPAVPAQKQGTGEFTPAGSSFHGESMTPKNAPYEAPGDRQSYWYWQG